MKVHAISCWCSKYHIADMHSYEGTIPYAHHIPKPYIIVVAIDLENEHCPKGGDFLLGKVTL